MSSTHKDNAALTFMEDREQLTLLGRQILRRMMNEAVEELRSLHVANQNLGKVESLLTSRDDVEKLLFSTVQAQLGPGADVQS